MRNDEEAETPGFLAPGRGFLTSPLVMSKPFRCGPPTETLAIKLDPIRG